MKVLITGGTSGFGQELVTFFSPNSLGLGRGNGWYFQDPLCQEKVAQESLEFDVFVNFAFIDPQTQLNLLKSVFNLWTDKKKDGLIVNFGTINTYYKRTSLNEYSIGKSAIDEACYQMAKMGLSGQTSVRTTNLRPGYLEMKKNCQKPHFKNGYSAQQVGEMIQFIFRQNHFIYPEIIVDERAIEANL
ncbi:MAG: hypothetical protein AAF203_08630 [Pseudomonadota bacterium]